MNHAEADVLMKGALGRLFRLGARPEQPGDVEEYEKIRAAVFAANDVLKLPEKAEGPNWARDRLKGAQGD